MSYKKLYKITLTPPIEKEEAIIGIIYSCFNVDGIEEKDNVFTIYVPKEEYKELKIEDIQSVLSDFINPEMIHIETIDYNPANEIEWKKYFKPSKIGNKVVVMPSWETYKAQSKDDVVIILDPGMAFGTGLHETTKGVISLLEEVVQYSKDLSQTKLLDAGTGSGILAIAAKKLGIGNVSAFDNDPLAVQIAEENININKCSIEIYLSSLDEMNGPYDIILANILSEILTENYPQFLTATKKGSRIILSGILAKDTNKVIECFTQNKKFELQKSLELGEWTSLLMVRTLR